MRRFIESIKIKDGNVHHLPLHNQRLNSTRRIHFKDTKPLDLKDFIQAPKTKGLYKCRVIYGREILKIEYLPYTLPIINSLQLVYGDQIDYSFKSTDRSVLKNQYAKRGTQDDILIVKNNCITDTYFCNVVFEKKGKLFTPTSYLLNGIKRQVLLKSGQIEEKEITVSQLKQFERVYLINALIDLEDAVIVEISAIMEPDSPSS